MNDHPERTDEFETSPKNVQSSDPLQPITVDLPPRSASDTRAGDTRASDDNPFAPARILAGDENAANLARTPEKPYTPRTTGQTIHIWTVICSVAAAPSFFLGMGVTDGEIAGMIMGISIFIGIYSWADLATRSKKWRRDATIRSTLRWTYGVRLVVSICFPVGFFVDLMCGFLTVELTQMLTHQSLTSSRMMHGFQPALLATLIQGTLLNAVLAVFAAALYGIRLGIRAIWIRTA